MSEFSDLSYFLLGICEGIMQEDIVSVTVTIDGKMQDVVWGKNIEIKTAEKPDDSTGCIGLKFNLQSADSSGQFCGAKRMRCGASGLIYNQ